MTDVPSEKTQAKAAEYLLSGRVKVQHSTMEKLPDKASLFLGYVTSANQEPGDPYFVTFNETGWHCDCPARVQVCAHILACQTITDFQNSEKPAHPTFTKSPDMDALLEGL